jgi:hypothetical protein
VRPENYGEAHRERGNCRQKYFGEKTQEKYDEASIGQPAITGISTLGGTPLKAQTRLYFLHTNVAQYTFYDVGV